MSHARRAKILLPRSTRIELGSGAKSTGNPSPKPFDVLAEGLFSKSSRGERTPLALFIAGVRGWEAGLRRFLVGELDSELP
jgi:hypothetical protein